MKAVFKSIETLIANYLNDEGYLTEEDIIYRIEEAFEDGDLSKKEYNILMELVRPSEY